MNKKKILSLVLVVVLLVTAVSGTLAYFTDTEEANNVFTVGNVDIVLHEQGEIGGKLYTEQDYRDALANYQIMPGITVGKRVWVENTGTAPAYVQVIMTIPNGLTLTWNENLGDEWTRVAEDMGDYTLYTFELKEALAGGAKTGNLLESFGLAADVTEYAAGEYEIPVYAYAIQAAGFEKATAAYAALTQEALVFSADATYTTSSLIAPGTDGALQATAGILTIEGNGIVNAKMDKDGWAMAVWANGGDVVINGGTFIQSGISDLTQTYDLIYASKGATVTINGGVFMSATPQWTLNAKDGNGTFVVKGGRFYKFDPSNAKTEPGWSEGNNTNWVPEGYAVVQDGDWYEVVDVRVHIKTVEDLKAFRDSVNAGNTYEGKIVVLDADLDLAGSVDNNWLPIGGNSTPNGRNTAYFAGYFDGQGHTISNLYAHASNDVGLFGCVGLGADLKGGIVNLTLKNVDIEGGARIGAFVGTMHSTKNKADTFYFDNLTLTGDVKISGGNRYVGGMFGFLCNSGLSNLTIDANEDSYVTNRADYGDSFELGGIAGEMNFGTENRTYKNIKSNLDVIGNTYSAGGLFGRFGRDNVVLENCEMTGDVTLYKAVDQGDGWCRAGGLIASPNGTGIVIRNSSFTGTLKAFTADGVEMTQPEGLNPAFGKVDISGVTIE